MRLVAQSFGEQRFHAVLAEMRELSQVMAMQLREYKIQDETKEELRCDQFSAT